MTPSTSDAMLVDQLVAAAKLVPALLTAIGFLVGVIGWFIVRWMNRVEDAIKDVAKSSGETATALSKLSETIGRHDERLDANDEDIAFLKNAVTKAKVAQHSRASSDYFIG